MNTLVDVGEEEMLAISFEPRGFFTHSSDDNWFVVNLCLRPQSDLRSDARYPDMSVFFAHIFSLFTCSRLFRHLNSSVLMNLDRSVLCPHG